MTSKIRSVLTILLFATITAAGSSVWAAHGHGGGGGGWGGGGGGHGWSGGGHGWSGGHGWNGGHVNFNHGHFDGHSNFRFNNNGRFFGFPFAFYGYPYLSSYYGYPGSYYYGYPYSYSYPTYYYSYPNGYFANGDENYSVESSPQQYVVSRPVADVARLEVRLPDPQATIWVQGQEITSAGNVRQFDSPQLDPTHQYTYTVKAAWNDNGKSVSDERQVSVSANAPSVVDFTKPAPTAASAQLPPVPALPPPQQQPSNP